MTARKYAEKDLFARGRYNVKNVLIWRVGIRVGGAAASGRYSLQKEVGLGNG